MNNNLQQRYMQMQRMMANRQDANTQMFNTFNTIGNSVFGPMAGATKDNMYEGTDLSGYRNDSNKNLSDKELYNQTFGGINNDFRTMNQVDISNGLGMNYANQFSQSVNPNGGILGAVPNNGNEFSSPAVSGQFGYKKKNPSLMNYNWLGGGI